MKLFRQDSSKYFWFTGGFAVGLTLISLSQAALPKHAAPQKQTALVSEIKDGKVGAPNLDQDFNALNSLESRYAESGDQQQRLKNATSRVAHVSKSVQKTPKKKSRQ